MSAHLTDELPGLLSGEATREAVLAAAEHLRTCVDCQQELVSAVVAHASLRSAQRFAPEAVRRPATGAPGPTSGATPLPDMSAVFAQIRSEVDADRTSSAPRDVPRDASTKASKDAPTDPSAYRSDRSERGSRQRRALALAAAAVVLVGGTATVTALATRDSGSSGSSSGGRTVALAAFDQGHTPATATIHGGAIAVDATSLPTLANRRYEVWLTNAGRTRMQPVGWVGNDGWAKLSVPKDMMAQYDDLEVSVQNVNQQSYSYSGTSVLRGSLS